MTRAKSKGVYDNPEIEIIDFGDRYVLTNWLDSQDESSVLLPGDDGFEEETE